MQEQMEAKFWEARTLADKKEFVAAAALAAEGVALAENCRISASQRKALTGYHEIVEQMATRQQEMASQQQHASSAAAADTSRHGANQDATMQKEIYRLMAQSDYQRAQWLPPSHHAATSAAQLLCRVAELKFLVRDFRGAATDLTTAEYLQPCDAAHLKLRGRIRMELCDYSGAAEDLSSTADSAELLELRGIARFCTGQIEDAFADIARADSTDPGLADKFTEMLENAVEKYGDPAEEYMAGQIAALKAMLKDAHRV